MVTIDELGQKAVIASPKYHGLTASEAGKQLLTEHPEYWKQVDDGIIATHLESLKDARYKEVSGIWAFFGKLGERHRAEFFERRVQTAKALVDIERTSRELKDIALQEQLKVANVALAVAQAKAAIHKLGVDAGLLEQAAEKGRSLESHQIILHQQASAEIQKDLVAHGHNLETKTREQLHQHVQDDKRLDSSLRISEAQNQFLLEKQIEELRYQISTAQADQQHKFTVAIEHLKFELREKEKQLEHRLEQEIIEKETASTIQLANTDELSRQQKLQILMAYNRDVQAETNKANKHLMRREIERLTKELFPDEKPSGMAGQKAAGNNPEGGGTPPESGNQPSGPPRSGKPSDSSEDNWLVN